MDEYRRPYLILFNAYTDAIDYIEEGLYEQAKEKLIEAHQLAESIFIHDELHMQTVKQEAEAVMREKAVVQMMRFLDGTPMEELDELP